MLVRYDFYFIAICSTNDVYILLSPPNSLFIIMVSFRQQRVRRQQNGVYDTFWPVLMETATYFLNRTKRRHGWGEAIANTTKEFKISGNSITTEVATWTRQRLKTYWQTIH